MRKLIAALALSLIFAAPASATTVTSLTDLWLGGQATISGNAVVITSESNANYGFLTYWGYNGQTVADLSHIVVTLTYTGTAPRVGINFNPYGTLLQIPAVVHLSDAQPLGENTYDFRNGHAQSALDAYDAAKVTGISIQNGSPTSSTRVTYVNVDGSEYTFAEPSTEPDPGDDPTGDDEPVDQTPTTGGTTPVSTIDNDDAGYEETYDGDNDSYADASPVVATKQLVGNRKRVIHVAQRKHERFISARATLRGKKLHVNGRSITVDLRNRPAGSYKVRITAKYLRHGKLHVVKYVRHLSVNSK